MPRLWMIPVMGLMTTFVHGVAASDQDVCRSKFDTYKAAVLAHPDDEGAWSRLRGCVTALKRWRDGQTISEEVLKKNPENGSAHLLIGIGLMRTKEYEKAATEFDEAIRLQPKNALAYYHFGMAQLFLDKPDMAQKASRKAIEIEPGNALHYSQLAYASLLVNELDTCETAGRQAVALDPDNVAAYKVLGNLYQRQGKQAEADKMFEAAIHANGRQAAGPTPAKALPGMTAPAKTSNRLAPRTVETGRDDDADPITICLSQWEIMKDAIMNGNIERAISYYSDYGDTREQYRAAFQRMGPKVKDVFSNIGELTDCETVLGTVTCRAIVRGGQGTVVETTVRFERNSDRAWRVRSF